MAKEKTISRHRVAGVILKCPICENNEFWTRKTLMNTPGLTFLSLDWANRNADNYVCSSCGHVLWFLNK
jgi:hypothetical protein